MHVGLNNFFGIHCFVFVNFDHYLTYDPSNIFQYWRVGGQSERSMIGVQYQLVICRGYVRISKDTFFMIEGPNLLLNSDFSLCHLLRSNFKVLQMSCEIIPDKGSHT